MVDFSCIIQNSLETILKFKKRGQGKENLSLPNVYHEANEMIIWTHVYSFRGMLFIVCCVEVSF